MILILYCSGDPRKWIKCSSGRGILGVLCPAPRPHTHAPGRVSSSPDLRPCRLNNCTVRSDWWLTWGAKNLWFRYSSGFLNVSQDPDLWRELLGQPLASVRSFKQVQWTHPEPAIVIINIPGSSPAAVRKFTFGPRFSGHLWTLKKFCGVVERTERLSDGWLESTTFVGSAVPGWQRPAGWRAARRGPDASRVECCRNGAWWESS